MGLDLVELQLAIEDDFGIHIDDAAAAKMETPGDVSQFLLCRLRNLDTDSCPSQRGFYRLRRALVEVFGADRKSVRPKSKLAQFLPGSCRTNWRTLRLSVGANDFPRLERGALLYISSVAVFPLAIAAWLISIDAPFFILIWVPVLAAYLGNIATYWLGNRIPRGASTVADLIPYVECRDSSVWSYDKVLDRVIEITSVQLGVPAEEIHEKSEFVNDLGAD